MAGVEHHKVKLDPALMKLDEIRKNRYKYFRWTPKTVRTSVIYLIVVPSIIGYLGYHYDGKWDFRGKRRGDDIREF